MVLYPVVFEDLQLMPPAIVERNRVSGQLQQKISVAEVDTQSRDSRNDLQKKVVQWELGILKQTKATMDLDQSDGNEAKSQIVLKSER